MLEILGVWVAVFLTLAAFSFLYKDNPIYKFAEHLFVGIATGYTLIQAWTGTLDPNLYQPLKEALLGPSAENGRELLGHWKRTGALVLGILVLARLDPRASWVSRWPLAVLIGTFAALRLTGYAQSDLVQQINGTLVPLTGADLPWFAWQGPAVFNHAVLIVGVLCVLVYFFFSLEQKGVTKPVAYVGTFFLMVTFGSSFGYTVLARVSLLIGRAQDMYEYAGRSYGYATFVCAAIILAYLIGWEWLKRRQEKRKTD